MEYDALLIDAGTGNLHSVHNALQKLGFNHLVTANPDDLPARAHDPAGGGGFWQLYARPARARADRATAGSRPARRPAVWHLCGHAGAVRNQRRNGRACRPGPAKRARVALP
jgi:hypothetical protein